MFIVIDTGEISVERLSIKQIRGPELTVVGYMYKYIYNNTMVIC